MAVKSMATVGSIVDEKIKNIEGFYELELKMIVKKFYNDENHYGIYLCHDMETRKCVNVVGIMPKLISDRTYICNAEFIIHDIYGEQFQVVDIYSTEVSSEDEEQIILRELISSDLIYNEIIKKYPSPITSFQKGEIDYKNIKGMGEKLYEKFLEKVIESQKYLKAIAELSKYNLSFKLIKKLVDIYKSSEVAVEMVFKNPYFLYKDIKGVGFKKADLIAKSLGFKAECMERKIAGLFYVLEQHSKGGHTFMHLESCKSSLITELMVTVPEFERMICSIDFHVEDKKIALLKVWTCEMNIAEELVRVNHSENKSNKTHEEIKNIVQKIESELSINYSNTQKFLFYAVNDNNCVILTGYAGTGKTTLMNGCLNMFEKHFDGINSMLLVSPSAKAAKVLSEATDRPAVTIHRALGWTPKGFIHDKGNPLRCDVVIIEEASMIDIYLWRSLLSAIPEGCKIIILGDTAQLESIAVGNVLHDMINSGIFAVVALDEVFRQALNSGSLLAATYVRKGTRFYKGADNKLIELGIEKDCKVWLGNRIDSPQRLGLLYKACLEKWNSEDILVISPMKNGDTGVNNLNLLIQAVANPEVYIETDSWGEKQIKTPCTKNGVFRLGDKVRHTKNDYKAVWYDKDLMEIEDSFGIFNGEFGIVNAITGNDYVFVDYGEKMIMYSPPYKNLSLAYCITCHSSQGSQAEVVIGVMDSSHYLNLKRNLLYTMITRTKSKLYLLAEENSLDVAIKNNTVEKKQTLLESILKDSL